jgi:hypothetical protein
MFHRAMPRQSRMVFVSLALFFVLSVAKASAQASNDDGSTTASPPDARGLAPLSAFALSAGGALPRTVGGSAFGGAVLSGQAAALSGGFHVWGSPIDHLTLVCNGLRSYSGDLSPELGLNVRFWGERDRGWSLGGSALYKNEGFAEIEGEVEGGFLVSFHNDGYHLDLNAVAGGGEDELDAEGKLRLGKDLGRFVRLGLDSQVRKRLAGEHSLPGGRSWDFVGGLQTTVAAANYFATVTAGPSTQAVERGVGAVAMLMVGASTL